MKQFLINFPLGGDEFTQSAADIILTFSGVTFAFLILKCSKSVQITIAEITMIKGILRCSIMSSTRHITMKPMANVLTAGRIDISIITVKFVLILIKNINTVTKWFNLIVQHNIGR